MKIKKLQTVIDINTHLLDAYYYLMLEYQNNKEYLKAYTTGLSAGNDWKKQKYFYDEQEEKIYTYLAALICLSIPFMTYAKAFVNIIMICLFLILILTLKKDKITGLFNPHYLKIFFGFLIFVIRKESQPRDIPR